MSKLLAIRIDDEIFALIESRAKISNNTISQIIRNCIANEFMPVCPISSTIDIADCCPVCNEKINVRWRYCPSCGRRLIS